ncbi:MAG: single-stranded DNA-binding protein [Ghiorsea sp.]
MNLYAFTGRLTRDCERRVTQGGMTICSFSVAVDFGYGDNKGTNWIRCSLFGKRAEGGLPQYLIKGAQVAISGELRIGEYETREGIKKTSVDVNISDLTLIGSKQDNQAQSQQPQQNYQQPQSNAQQATDPHIPF